MAEIPQDAGPFSEYKYFDPPLGDEAAAADRADQNAQFQAGQVTNPTFEYGKLHSTDLPARKSIYDAALSETTDEVKRATLVARQKGVEIAMASLDLNTASTHTERWQAGQRLNSASEARYSELEPALFWPVMAAKTEIATNFKPGNAHAAMLQERLLAMLPEVPQGTAHNEVLTQELLDTIRPEVMKYLEPILSVIPEKGDFNSAQIMEMAHQALENVGLAQEGWEPSQRSNTDQFSVENSNKQVIIPNPEAENGKEFTKSAEDLRRLFAHEIGIHAMRRDKSLGVDFEEGLGLLVEAVVTNSTNGVAVQRAENRYLHAGLAEGLDGKPADGENGPSTTIRNARQVFEITWRLEAMKLAIDGIISPAIEAKAKKAVQTHINNIYRGTDHKLPGVYYNKAKVYLEGIIQAAAYAKEHAAEEGWLAHLVANGSVQKAA